MILAKVITFNCFTHAQCIANVHCTVYIYNLFKCLSFFFSNPKVAYVVNFSLSKVKRNLKKYEPKNVVVNVLLAAEIAK